MNYTHFALIAASTLMLSACAASNNQDVWSTKGQSRLAAKTDSPSLHVNDETIAGEVAASPAELRKTAISILMQASESPNPLLRANAIEALHAAPDQLEPVVQRALGDENRAVRFVAAMTAGKYKLANLKALLNPLALDESPSVRAAAMYALKRLGDAVDLNPLAEMLYSEDPEVKGNAAYVLGEIGEPSGIIPLRQAAGRGLERASLMRRKVVELQLAEAMAKLGSHRELQVIRAALFTIAEESELAALACQMCGELRDSAALNDLTNMVYRKGNTERPAEIRMAAALAVAKIDATRQLVDVPASYTNHSRPELRAQAAHTLGAMRAGGKASAIAQAHLTRLLGDPSPLVQVAAAGGILRLHPEMPAMTF